MKVKEKKFHFGNFKYYKLLFIFILYTTFVFFSGVSVYKNSDSKYYLSQLRDVLFDTKNFLRGAFNAITSEPANRLSIDIKFKKYKKLEYDRDVALSIGTLVSNKYVPAKINVGGISYNVKIRLKGDLNDHLLGSKWSFRVKVVGDNTIWGMKQFSLHHPNTRNYVYEWLYHKILKIEGLISLRYDFLRVVLNGRDLGIYAIEEHFEKRLLEYNARKNGPIIRFNENLMWDEFINYSSFSDKKSPKYGSYYSSNIDAFQSTKLLEDSILFHNYKSALALLESFRNEELKTSDVFDVDLLSTYFAVVDLLRAEHGARWHNMRFYYNPITSKLEPIGFDAEAGKQSITTLIGIEANNIVNHTNNNLGREKSYYKSIFKDQYFYKEYIKKLQKFSKNEYLDLFFENNGSEIDKKIKIINKEWPSYTMDKNILYDNQLFIQNMLSPSKALHSFIRDTHDKVEISFGSIYPLPIKIESISINNTLNVSPDSNIILSPKYFNDKVNYIDYTFNYPEKLFFEKITQNEIIVNYSIDGLNDIISTKAFPWHYNNKSFINKGFERKNSNIFDFNFLKIDEKNKVIKFPLGDWIINKDLIIPSEYDVILYGNTKLDLKNSALIYSHSALNLIGGEDSPIIITSSDSSGQGIFVLNANKPSYFKNVEFNKLSNPSKQNWSLTGAITFYQSDVIIEDCNFYNNKRGDDYLNIIRSDFKIRNSKFININLDAFDSDFCKGSVLNSIFKNVGNDGIDVSGSFIDIDNIMMDNIRDKGLSAGENSKVFAKNINIINSDISICSKDLSEVILTGAVLENNSIGFTAFQKKPEFGAAIIKADNVVMKNLQTPYLIEKKSFCEVNGVVEGVVDYRLKSNLYN